MMIAIELISNKLKNVMLKWYTKASFQVVGKNNNMKIHEGEENTAFSVIP